MFPRSVENVPFEALDPVKSHNRSGCGTSVARSPQFEAVRADRAKLGAYPRATAWTGHLLGQSRPRGRVVIANLGSGASDLLVADAIATRAQSAGLGTEVAL